LLKLLKEFDFISWVCCELWSNAQITYSSDYFQELYDLAIKLIKSGNAFVCHQKADEISEFRYAIGEGTASIFENVTMDFGIGTVRISEHAGYTLSSLLWCMLEAPKRFTIWSTLTLSPLAAREVCVLKMEFPLLLSYK